MKSFQTGGKFTRRGERVLGKDRPAVQVREEHSTESEGKIKGLRKKKNFVEQRVGRKKRLTYSE